MKVSHRISFPGEKQFEQHDFIFELDSEEVFNGTSVKLNPLQKAQILQSLVVINGFLAQRAEGYMDKDEYELRKKRVFSLLNSDTEKALVEVLNVSS